MQAIFFLTINEIYRYVWYGLEIYYDYYKNIKDVLSINIYI